MNQTKKSTIATIARELGVSPSTVSRAFDPRSRISDETRQEILKCAAEQHYVPNKAASRLSMREINIGLLYADTYDHAAEEFCRGVNDGYRELFDLKVNLRIQALDTAAKTLEGVKKALEEFRTYDGLIVSGLNLPEELALLDDFAQNTHLVLLQMDAPEIRRLFVSCHDSATSSHLAAEFLSNCLRRSPRKNVVIFTGDREADLHRKANDEFYLAAKRFGLCVVRSFDMKDSPQLLKRQIAQMKGEENNWPDGIFITSGHCLELCREIRENPAARDTVLVTFDVYRQMAQYLKEGIIGASIYQNLYQQAKNAFTYLVKHVIGEINVDSVVSCAPQLVLRSNMDYFLR